MYTMVLHVVMGLGGVQKGSKRGGYRGGSWGIEGPRPRGGRGLCLYTIYTVARAW